jgi:hypothetical protein
VPAGGRVLVVVGAVLPGVVLPGVVLPGVALPGVVDTEEIGKPLEPTALRVLDPGPGAGGVWLGAAVLVQAEQPSARAASRAPIRAGRRVMIPPSVFVDTLMT